MTKKFRSLTFSSSIIYASAFSTLLLSSMSTESGISTSVTLTSDGLSSPEVE